MGDLRVLVTAELDCEFLRSSFPGVTFDIAGYGKNYNTLESSELAAMISYYDVLITEFEMVTREVIEKAKKLKLIICCRGGYGTVIDVESAKERGIVLEHNAGRNADSVSEIVMGYILDWCRNISKSNALVHSRVITASERNAPTEYGDSIWGLTESSPYISLRGRSPKGMTLGIVGYGHVGRAVAKKAVSFGMVVGVLDPSTTSDDCASLQFDSLEELLRKSDVVSLHCSRKPGNDNLMGRKQFELMKPTAMFINTSRGQFVDEEALIWALQTGQIAAAAIDVSKQEPLRSNSLLLDISNLVITPHIAGSSDDVIQTGTRMTVEKLGAWLKSQGARDA